MHVQCLDLLFVGSERELDFVFVQYSMGVIYCAELAAVDLVGSVYPTWVIDLYGV